MPFLMTYTPTIQGSLIDVQVKSLQPPIGALVWGTAFRTIYADLITAMTTSYVSAATSLVVSFPPASPGPAILAPTPLVLAPLAGLAPIDGISVDVKVKAILGTSIPTWTIFFTQLYTSFGNQFALALSTALTSLLITAQPFPVPGVGLLAPMVVAPTPPWSPTELAPFTSQLLACAPISAAAIDAPIRAASLTGLAGGAVTWDIVIAQIALDLNTALATLATLIPSLMMTKLLLGPPALAAPVPPSGPTPLPPTPALVV